MLEQILRAIEARMQEHEAAANDPANAESHRRRAKTKYGEAQAIRDLVRAAAETAVEPSQPRRARYSNVPPWEDESGVKPVDRPYAVGDDIAAIRATRASSVQESSNG